MKINTPEEEQLLRHFEIVNGCTSDMFDDKDWVKFERFCERQYNEEELEMLEVPMPIYKQETVEETAQKLYPISDVNWTNKPKLDAFMAGAKWAQENLKQDYNTGYYDGMKGGIQWQKDRIEVSEKELQYFRDKERTDKQRSKEIISSLYTKEDMLEAFNAGNKRGHSGYPNTDNWTQPTFEYFLRKKETKTEEK